MAYSLERELGHLASKAERDAGIKTQYSGVRGWIERMLNVIGNVVLGGDFVFRQTTDGTPVRMKVGKDFGTAPVMAPEAQHLAQLIRDAKAAVDEVEATREAVGQTRYSIEVGGQKETSHSPNQPSDESDPTLNGAMGSNLSQLETATAVKNLNEMAARISNEGALGQVDFLNALSFAIGIAEPNPDKTRYLKDGEFTLRIANHRANALTFEQRGERTQIEMVLSRKDLKSLPMENLLTSTRLDGCCLALIVLEMCCLAIG